MKKPDWKKREALIRAWFVGTGSWRLERYWRRYLLSGIGSGIGMKFDSRGRRRKSRLAGKSANDAVITAVLSISEKSFTTRYLNAFLKKHRPDIKWNTHRVANILSHERAILSLTNEPYWGGYKLWRRKETNGALEGMGR